MLAGPSTWRDVIGDALRLPKMISKTLLISELCCHGVIVGRYSGDGAFAEIRVVERERVGWR